jgi:metal-dependent hydrolase (beta-lactamase superfamily II)
LYCSRACWETAFQSPSAAPLKHPTRRSSSCNDLASSVADKAGLPVVSYGGVSDTLILSHGHFDHWGGLSGFLDKHRKDLPADITMYAGGEDNFCQRYARAGQGELSDFGMLDRRDIAKQNVKLVLCESPVVIGGQAFTTGKVKRGSIEKVLPNTMVEFKLKDGAGCNASHYLPAEMEGRIVPDEHIHEHAPCFNLKDKGLIVVSSCGHVGIVNSVRQAMEVSGVEKIHAIMGGFHLGPAPADYLTQVVSEIGKLNPDVLIPMHCSGLNFHPGSTAADAGQDSDNDDRHPHQLRYLIREKAMAASKACALFVIASLFGGGLTAVAEQPSAAQTI